MQSLVRNSLWKVGVREVAGMAGGYHRQLGGGLTHLGGKLSRDLHRGPGQQAGHMAGPPPLSQGERSGWRL